MEEQQLKKNRSLTGSLRFAAFFSRRECCSVAYRAFLLCIRRARRFHFIHHLQWSTSGAESVHINAGMWGESWVLWKFQSISTEKGSRGCWFPFTPSQKLHVPKAHEMEREEQRQWKACNVPALVRATVAQRWRSNQPLSRRNSSISPPHSPGCILPSFTFTLEWVQGGTLPWKGAHGLGKHEEDILLLFLWPSWSVAARHQPFLSGPCFRLIQVFGALQNCHPSILIKS